MINNLPNGWEICFLNDKKTNEIKGSGILKFDGNKNYLSTESIKNNKINSIEEVITYEKRPSRANLQPEVNDVFFAKMKDTEKVLKITEEIEKKYILSTGFMPIKPYSKRLNSDFLTHYFKSETFNLQKNKLSYGGTQKALNNGNAKKISIPIPPLQQQEKIVKVLDLTLNLIEKQKELLRAYDLFLKSKFIEMFGDPILNPMDWKITHLENLIINIDGGWSPVCNDVPRSDKGNGILKLSALTNDIYNQNENKAMFKDVEPKYNVVVKKGDLLFSRKNTYELVGSSAYVFDTEENLFLPDLIFRINTNVKINKIFLWKLFTNVKYKLKLKSIASGTSGSMPNISKTKLIKLDCLCPPIELQNKFASIVEKIETIKEKENQKLKQVEDLHNSLMQKAFKGEIK